MAKKKRKYKTTAKQRAYGKKYYKKNKEKYKEYSKIGTAKRRSTVNKNFEVREKKRMTFTYSDLMKSRDEQTAKMINQIISGERMLVT
jgi:hypothetical protein